ncbi:exonuclease SbcCD subunit D [Candidatus Woesearchaeota archaeon]|nr:exonuclease SbcCD subunit D [Candidatus Woesearchaeota archaeon]
MKYAHLADLHLGSWRDEKMRELSTQAFLKAIEQCVSQQVDFILFSGDLFNTSLPSLDTLKIVTKTLKELQEKNIPLYAIAGSHDFSPSGKTMLDVLENAGLLVNVCKGYVNPETHQLHLKFTSDQKTEAKITGMLGKKGLLDKVYYQNLHLDDLEREEGYKIFLFHTTLSELKPKHLEKLESQPLSFLPKKFNYYAGGHIHHPTLVEQEGYGTLTYPGALFPNNFAELEQYGKGGYYLITVENNSQKIDWVPLEMIKHHKLVLNCTHKTPDTITTAIIDHFHYLDLIDTLVTIRLNGALESGRTADIDFKRIFEQLYAQKAYFVMKNTSGLEAEEFEEIKISSADSELVEEQLIREHLGQVKLFDLDTEFNLTKSLLSVLNTTKLEGETVADFQKRVEEGVNKVIGVN